MSSNKREKTWQKVAFSPKSLSSIGPLMTCSLTNCRSKVLHWYCDCPPKIPGQPIDVLLPQNKRRTGPPSQYQATSACSVSSADRATKPSAMLQREVRSPHGHAAEVSPKIQGKENKKPRTKYANKVICCQKNINICSNNYILFLFYIPIV